MGYERVNDCPFDSRRLLARDARRPGVRKERTGTLLHGPVHGHRRSCARARAVATTATPSGPLASTVHPLLLDPSNAKETAPAIFKAKFSTTKGDFVLEVHRDWAPNGADRIYNLVKLGFYDDTRFFRVVDGFMVQFGIGDPALSAKWQDNGIADEPGKESNRRGFVTFAQRARRGPVPPKSSSTRWIIRGSTQCTSIPFGQVVQGMGRRGFALQSYGEGAPMGAGPDQAASRHKATLISTPSSPSWTPFERPRSSNRARAGQSSRRSLISFGRP